jgi:hypothetical protein
VGIGLVDMRAYAGGKEDRPPVPIPARWDDAVHFAIDPIRVVASNAADVFSFHENPHSTRHDAQQPEPIRWRNATPILFGEIGEILGVVHHDRKLEDAEVHAVRGILSLLLFERWYGPFPSETIARTWPSVLVVDVDAHWSAGSDGRDGFVSASTAAANLKDDLDAQIGETPS